VKPDQQQPRTDRKVACLGGLFFLSLTIALIIFAIWGIAETHQQYDIWLAENAAILVEDTGISAFYGVPLLLVALFVFGLYGIWIGVTGRRSTQFDRHWLKPLSTLIVVGVLCVFMGRYIGNTLWSQSFQANGYTQCQGAFVLTGKWAVRVWSRSPLLCFDEDLKIKLRSPTYSLSDINAEYHAD